MIRSYLLNVQHTLYTTLRKDVLCFPMILKPLQMKAFGHFSVSSKCAEAIEIFDCLEVEGDSPLRHMPTSTHQCCWP